MRKRHRYVTVIVNGDTGISREYVEKLQLCSMTRECRTPRRSPPLPTHSSQRNRTSRPAIRQETSTKALRGSGPEAVSLTGLIRGLAG